MTIADTARENAIPLEVKKDGLQQRQNGDWVVRFTVQASDMNQRLTQAPMGTRYMAVLVEIGDDEQPVVSPSSGEATDAPAQPTERREWRELQPSAQAAIRCNEPVFWAFLREEMNQRVADSDTAATAVRKICNVNSRAHFNTNHVARVLWHSLDQKFTLWKEAERAA